MKLRKIFCLTLFLSLFLSLMLTIQVFAEVPYESLYYDGETHDYTSEKIELSINGVLLDDEDLPIQPINIDGHRTLVPLREVFENLGATVNFNSTNNEVTVIDGDNTVVVTVGSLTGYINGEEVAMDVEPKFVSLYEGAEKKVMIPLRFVGEGLGYSVNYDSSQRLVSVDSVVEEVADIEVTEINSDNIETISNERTNLTDYTLPTLDNQVVTFDFDTPITSVDTLVFTDGRLVIDVENSLLDDGAVSEDVNIGTLDNIRVSQFKTSPEYDTRIVLTFSADTTFSIYLSDDRKELSIAYADWGVVPVNPNDPTTDSGDSTTDSNDPDYVLNATKVEFSTDGLADAVLIYGEEEAPEVEAIVADKYTLYIDVAKPNTIEDDYDVVDGVGIEAYGIYDLDDDTTRIELSLKSECKYSVIENGSLTKVYIKPSETISSNGGDDIVDGTVISINHTPTTTTIRINKESAGISTLFDISNIQHIDNYMQNQYTLVIPISLQSVLNTPVHYDVNNENLNSIDVIENGSSTEFIFNGSKVLYADVSEDDSDIIFTIKSARDVYDKIIVIDAGHGGTDPGTIGYANDNTYYEKDVVLDIAKRVDEYISEDSRFKVYETRPDDVFVELYDRPEFSSNLEADLFISIHANASTSAMPSGIDTFYFDIDKEDESYLNDKGIYVTDYRREVTEKSKEFAEEIQGNLINATGAMDRGFKHDNLAVLRSNDIPSVLIEVGFMSNPTDLANLNSSTYRDTIARTIADTVIDFYDNY